MKYWLGIVLCVYSFMLKSADREFIERLYRRERIEGVFRRVGHLEYRSGVSMSLRSTDLTMPPCMLARAESCDKSPVTRCTPEIYMKLMAQAWGWTVEELENLKKDKNQLQHMIHHGLLDATVGEIMIKESEKVKDDEMQKMHQRINDLEQLVVTLQAQLAQKK